MQNKFILATGALALTLGSALAHAEIAVIGNPAGAALTQDQVTDIYLGKSNAATPLDLPEAAPIRSDFYKKATGRDSAQVKAVWSRLVFTSKGQPPKEYPDSAAVKKAVAADPKAIGYIEKSAVDGTVKVLLTLN